MVFPLLIQIPYSLLIANFEYPVILRFPAATILERYGAGGGTLTATWYAFALAIVPLLLAICLLPASVPRHQRNFWLVAATPLGVGSAVVQMAGLLRWVVLVPLIAQAWADSPDDPGLRRSIELTFAAQHQLFGVLLGEHLGQLLLGLWTLGIALAFPAQRGITRWQRGLGLLAGALFVTGSAGSLAMIFPVLTPLQPLASIAFLVWSAWCCWLGVTLLRSPAAPPPSSSGT